MPETGGRARIGVALAIAVVPSVVLAVVIDLSAAAAGSLAASGTVTTPETLTESPSQTPSPTPSEPTPPTPTPTDTPSATPSESPSASPSASAAPTGTQTPTAPTVDQSAAEPRPAAVRAILTADASRLGGLAFDGVVVHETAAGKVRALRFGAEDVSFDNLQVDLTQAGRTFRMTSSGTTVLSGDVVMDVALLRATFAGAQVEFTPDTPPPAAVLLPAMEFTDVEIHIVQVDAGLVTIPGHSQSYVS